MAESWLKLCKSPRAIPSIRLRPFLILNIATSPGVRGEGLGVSEDHKSNVLYTFKPLLKGYRDRPTLL